MSRTAMKGLFVAVLTILFGVVLAPTFQYYSMSQAQRAAMPAAKLAKLRKGALNLGLDLQGGAHLVYEVDLTELPETAKADAVDRAIEIIRNRIDQLGVAEPVVQRQGQNRILVQLPGVLDTERAKDIVGRTARLEFKIDLGGDMPLWMAKGNSGDEIPELYSQICQLSVDQKDQGTCP